MKKLYAIVCLLFCLISKAQQPFITTWLVGPLVSYNNEIVIPTVPDLDYNYSVDLGNGTVFTNITGDFSHTFTTPGPHTISISGQFPAIRFNAEAVEESQLKIQSVEQWGDIEWQTMHRAFAGCENLVINAADAPDLSQVTDMSGMFINAANVNQPVNHWDVSNVTDFSALFQGASAFNQPLDLWDVSSATDLKSMFNYGAAFNQPLNMWDVSNVTDMSGMFRQAVMFNQPLSNWNTANVTILSNMFSNADAFNQNINSWNVSNVSYFSGMFWNANLYNQPLDNWDVSSAIDISEMFAIATLFDQPLNNWDVSNVQSMIGMFAQALSFNQPLDNWNVSNVDHMQAMFHTASTFNQPLDSWNFSPSVSLMAFLSFSGLDLTNYDALLAKFQQLGLQQKSLGASNLEYCNVVSRDHLINIMNWTIIGDSLVADCSLSILEMHAKQLVLFPVPSNQQLYIETVLEITNLEIFDTTGKNIHSQNESSKAIDISHLAAGHYFLKIHTDKNVIIKKFIKL